MCYALGRASRFEFVDQIALRISRASRKRGNYDERNGDY
jgi:hypothetical protein